MGLPVAFRARASSLRSGALALVAVAVIGCVDVLTGPEFGLSLFLAIPVFVATDRTGLGGGAVVAVASVASWVAAQLIGQQETTRWTPIAWNASVRAGLFGVIVALALTRKKLSEAEVAASIDSLTGIANRRAFDEALERELARGKRSGRPLTIAYIDCDNFKAINDRFGHSTGNDLLRAVASTLVSSIRAVDLGARIGGDEFAAMLVDVDAGLAREILERVRSKLLAAMTGHQWAVTFSIGAVTAFDLPASGTGALQIADRLMYQVKNRGKDALVHEIVGSPALRERGTPPDVASYEGDG